jgi:hypothetical protein
MIRWFEKKLRMSRLWMNLKLLEVTIVGVSPQATAAVVAAAGAMLEGLQTDNPMSGIIMSRAVLEPFGTTASDALNFYNVLEDVLSKAEAQRTQAVKHMSATLGAIAAHDFDHQLRVQQDGVRLLMVALARKVEDDFKSSARVLRESVHGATDHVPAAVEQLRQQYERSHSPSTTATPPNYEKIRVNSNLLAFAAIGW